MCACLCKVYIYTNINQASLRILEFDTEPSFRDPDGFSGIHSWPSIYKIKSVRWMDSITSEDQFRDRKKKSRLINLSFFGRKCLILEETPCPLPGNDWWRMVERGSGAWDQGSGTLLRGYRVAGVRVLKKDWGCGNSRVGQKGTVTDIWVSVP